MTIVTDVPADVKSMGAHATPETAIPADVKATGAHATQKTVVPADVKATEEVKHAMLESEVMTGSGDDHKRIAVGAKLCQRKGESPIPLLR